MPQTISAIYYIKNNKRRVAVLAVSLAMLFIVNYLAMFLLSTTTETFSAILAEATQYVQYIELKQGDIQLDVSDPEKSVKQINMEAVSQKYEEIAPKIRECEGVEEVYLAEVEYTYVGSIVGNYYVEIPLVSEPQMQKLLDKMGTTLVDGRLPQRANEVVLDMRFIKNYGYELGDCLSQNKEITIVGALDCDYYFGCGLADEGALFHNPEICVVTDGTIEDLRALLKSSGIPLEHSEFVDVAEGKKELKRDIVDVIDSSTEAIFVGFMIIVAILVIIVNISYMRDRRSEWCLYASIGYGRKTIYFSIMRELLFIFALAFMSALAVCALSMRLLDIFVVSEMGLRCTYIMPDTFIRILCAYIALFGLMQIPVSMEISRIRTIDAIDDDM